MSIFKQSDSAKRLRRIEHLGFLKLQFAAKYQKTWKGNLLRQKNGKKVAQCQKNSKGDPIVSSGFVSYAKNGKIESGGLWNNLDAFPVAGLVV